MHVGTSDKPRRDLWADELGLSMCCGPERATQDGPAELFSLRPQEVELQLGCSGRAFWVEGTSLDGLDGPKVYPKYSPRWRNLGRKNP